MTRTQLIDALTLTLAIPRKESETVLQTVFESMVNSLRAGDKVEIRGFGSFRLRQRRARMGRNPKTGAQVEVQARRIAYFKPAKELRDVLNNPSSESAFMTFLKRRPSLSQKPPRFMVQASGAAAADSEDGLFRTSRNSLAGLK